MQSPEEEKLVQSNRLETRIRGLATREQDFLTYLVNGLIARGMSRGKARRVARKRIVNGKKVRD